TIWMTLIYDPYAFFHKRTGWGNLPEGSGMYTFKSGIKLRFFHRNSIQEKNPDSGLFLPEMRKDNPKQRKEIHNAGRNLCIILSLYIRCLISNTVWKIPAHRLTKGHGSSFSLFYSSHCSGHPSS